MDYYDGLKLDMHFNFLQSVFKEDQAKLKELRQENSKLEDENHNLRLKIIRLE